MKTLCILPWLHFATKPNGEVSACCQQTEPFKVNDKEVNFLTDPIESFWFSKEMNDFRTALKNNERPKSCESCWAVEDAGKESLRQIFLKSYKHKIYKINEPLELPIHLDLKLGRVCNLKCRICSSHCSSKWAEDEIKLYGNSFSTASSYWIEEDDYFWNQLESLIPKLEFLKFTGGEPLLIKKQFELLKKCIELGYSKNIRLQYITNGTVKIQDYMLDIWKEFYHTEILFSIDSVGHKFEYLRHPAKWSTVQENFEKISKFEFIKRTICHTVSIHNIMYIDEFENWMDQINFKNEYCAYSLLQGPEYYNIQNFSLEVKNQIKENVKSNNPKVKELINFMLFKNDLNLIDEFKMITNNLDLIRKEKFTDIFPELANVLKY